MKLNIQQTDMEPIRRLLTCADSDQVIAVGSEDVDNLLLRYHIAPIVRRWMTD